jgi:hypothetical protein
MKVGIKRTSRSCQLSLFLPGPRPRLCRNWGKRVKNGALRKKGRLAAPLMVEVEGSYIWLFFWMTLGVKKIRSSFFVLSVS